MGDVYTNPPQSRNEAILNSIVEGTTYTDPPQSRIEDLLLQVKDVIEEGGHDESATRASIAPTESDSAHASKNIAVGEQFYLSDDKLYTATSPISQGSAIVVYPTASYNCKLSDSVTEQIKSLDDSKVENSVIGNVEDGATASQAYAVGEHFIRGGKFCTCKQAIAINDPFTLNTNYVEGKIADLLYGTIQNPKLLTSSDDIDNVTDMGYYYWSASSPQNVPSVLASNSTMEVIQMGESYRIQIIYHSSSNIWIRHKSASWSAWQKVNVTTQS